MQEHTFIHGTSMAPTFKPFDRLSIRPYGRRPMRRGDVIAFFPPGAPGVAHRIVRITGQGIVTKGDANPSPDPWVLTPAMVAGRVTHAFRGKKKFRVYGGALGAAWGRQALLAHRIGMSLRALLAAVYRRCTAVPAVKKVFSLCVRTRVFFIDASRYEIQAYCGPKLIGRYLSQRRQWYVARHFRALLDTARLPTAPSGGGPLFRPFAGTVLLLFAVNLLSSTFNFFGPYLAKLFIDDSFLKRDLHAFIVLSLVSGAVGIASIACALAGNVLTNRYGIRTHLLLARLFVKKLFALDAAFFQTQATGETMYRLADVERIKTFIVEWLPTFLANIARLIVVLAIALAINTRLACVLIAASPLFFLQSAYFRRKLKPLFEATWQLNSRLSKKTFEAFSRIMLIKAFGLEGTMRRRYTRSLIHAIRAGLRTFTWSMMAGLSSTLVSRAVLAALTLYGGWMIIRGELSLGSYSAVMLYLVQVAGLMQALSSGWELLSRDTVSLEKFFETLRKVPAIQDAPGALPLTAVKGAIEFRDTWFGYQPGRPVFKGLCLTLPAGAWIGVTGPSGCGKTTLATLILRLYDPDQGQILVDGTDLRRLQVRTLRERMCIAPQEPYLFDATFKENIAFGKHNIGMEQMQDAARLVQLHDFIAQLPQGYDTLIGENACRLSQGLKQRLALARAVVREPDLLILDEATASVDTLTEGAILTALRRARQGKTTLVISHRIASIQDADRVYYFTADGRVTDGNQETS